MANGINSAIIFLIDSLFSLYITVLFVRILLQLGRANPQNPLTRFIITITPSATKSTPLAMKPHCLPGIN